MKKLYVLLLLLFSFTKVYALDCYTASQVVPFGGYFHDDTGTLATPTSQKAVLRVTPFTGTSTWCDNTGGTDACTGTDEGTLPAPTNLTRGSLGAKTGFYGGEYTIGSAAAEGTREISFEGTVATAKNVGKIVKTFQVRTSCTSSGTVAANVTQWNGTNVATPDAAGYPVVTVKDGTGTGEINTASGLVDITQVGADKVWGTAARVLTAGTNIALAKGTGVTGFNDLSAAQVNTEADTALADARLDELVAADSDIDGVAPPVVGSVFHELMSKTAGSFTYDQTTDSNEAIRDNMSSGGLTSQEVRDAMKLAPTAGTPATGSVDEHLDDILTDTAVIGSLGAGLSAIPWNPAWDTEVESEVTDALNVYDPPTRAELTTDKDSIITEVNANETKIDAVDNFVDTEVTDIQNRLPASLVSGRMSSDMVALSGDTVAADALESAYDGTGYCEGCIAVTVSSGAATPASPLVITETTIITVNNQFKKQTLRCGKQERFIAVTDATADAIVVEPGNPFTGVLSGTCYIK